MLHKKLFESWNIQDHRHDKHRARAYFKRLANKVTRRELNIIMNEDIDNYTNSELDFDWCLEIWDEDKFQEDEEEEFGQGSARAS